MTTNGSIPRSQDLDPRARVNIRPGDEQPKPTGFYPQRWWPDNPGVHQTPVIDELYRDPARREVVSERSELVDQHPWLQIDATWQPPPEGPRKDGRHDPLPDGLPRPTPRLAHLHYNRSQGASHTQVDDTPGIQFPVGGSQDGASWSWLVNSRAAMAPYAPPAGQTEMPDSLQAIPPSPPHGWTSIPVRNSRQDLIDKARALRQTQPPRQDRLASSTYSGQTFGQRTAHVGQTVRGGGQLPGWRSRG